MSEKEKALISACLLGVNCKYSCGNNRLPEEVLLQLNEKYSLIPVCPESYGGLPGPRLPAERVGDRVLASDGTDVTRQFERGAEATLTIARTLGARLAILKENSPSCGSGRIYDGSFSGTLVDGYGVAAQHLKAEGVTVIGERAIMTKTEKQNTD